MQLDFLAAARNVVLVAPQGLVKTMIAQNVTHAALLADHAALFVAAAQMLLHLGAQESARALDRRLRYYASRPLLCLDEIAYLSYDAHNAGLPFQVVSRFRFCILSVSVNRVTSEHSLPAAPAPGSAVAGPLTRVGQMISL